LLPILAAQLAELDGLGHVAQGKAAAVACARSEPAFIDTCKGTAALQ